MLQNTLVSLFLFTVIGLTTGCGAVVDPNDLAGNGTASEKLSKMVGKSFDLRVVNYIDGRAPAYPPSGEVVLKIEDLNKISGIIVCNEFSSDANWNDDFSTLTLAQFNKTEEKCKNVAPFSFETKMKFEIPDVNTIKIQPLSGLFEAIFVMTK